jgi:hypothetical protein
MKKAFMLFACTCCFSAAKAQIPNPGMETWHNYTSGGTSMTAPNGWLSMDSMYRLILGLKKPGSTYKPMVTKETIFVHTGSAATRLKSTIQDDTTIRVAMLSLGRFTGDKSDPDILLADGGIPIAGQVEKVSAWLSFNQSDSQEVATFTAYAIQSGTAYNGGDSVVGFGGGTISTPIPGYGKVEIRLLIHKQVLSRTGS